MKKEIRILNHSDSAAYKALLSLAFGSAHGFMVRPEATNWSMTEDFYTTLGVFHDSQLVSCMRVESVLSRKELDYKLMGQYQNSEIIFPAMYLTKAGTSPNIKAKGLNSILRYLALQIALNWKVRFVFGTMVEGSPRVFTMQEMGYQFQKSEKKWDGLFISEKMPMMACLDLKTKGDQALRYLEKKLGPYLIDYQVQFKVEDIKINFNSNVKWPWSA